jgi:L-ascorbate metabolism protein UlaG (beta-lactamase superfamily)
MRIIARMTKRISLIALSLLLAACSGSSVQFDPNKAHHGDGEFVSVKRGSLSSHSEMRAREGDPPVPTAAELASIVTPANLELIRSPADQPRVTWIGHATSLVQYRGINYLTDPHLSEYPFRFNFWVEPRVTQPALAFEQMPDIDFVVISHNHYDSLDHRTVDRFGDSVTWYVPLGLKAWFTDRGISPERVVELDWWDSHRFADHVEITFTPSQHWSRRGLWDSNKTLWGGWAVKIDGFNSWFAGDTGYNESYFSEIGRRLGPFRLAMIPIGAYAPRYFMAPAHIDPAQAVDIHLLVGAEQSLPVHWGTFQLTIEPILEPAQLLEAEMRQRGLPARQFRPAKIGETLVLP